MSQNIAGQSHRLQIIGAMEKIHGLIQIWNSRYKMESDEALKGVSGEYRESII